MPDILTMRAAVLDEARAPFRLATLPRPIPGPGHVLVRVRAASINPLDTKIQDGAAAHARQALPAVLGIDVAGEVVACGEGVGAFAPGEAVYGMVGGVGGNQGTLAEYIAVDAALLARKPAAMDMRAAAALPLVVITAWEGLVDRSGVQAGQRVLVHGGGGGVGHVAIQIARHFGATVFATEGAQKCRFVESLGAAFIDRQEAVPDYVARVTDGVGFDLVYDTVGGAVLDASFEAVRRFGHVVSCLGWGTHALAPLSFRSATYSGVFTLLPLLSGEGRARHGEILTDAARIADAGGLVPRLDPRRFRLKDVDAAFAAMRDKSAQGKIVVEIE